MFVEIRHDHFGIGVLLKFQDDAQSEFFVRLVIEFEDLRQVAAVDDLAEFSHQRVRLDAVGDRVNHDAIRGLLPTILFEPPFGADFDRAAAFLVHQPQRGAIGDDAASHREVGAFDVLHQLRDGDIAVGVDEIQTSADQLFEIVRRDVCRHADRDAADSVGQQVRIASRQHDRLVLASVVVRPHFDGVEPQLVHELLGDRGQPSFRVPLMRGRQPHDRAEVALTIHQRIPHGEVLSHANERLVDRDVTVWVVVRERLTDDSRALSWLRGGEQPEFLEHHVEDASLDRFQPVAHVG